MGMSIGAAMKVFEKGDFAAAERAFASVSAGARDVVIARFRRAECLSRLGRHDEAVADARSAYETGASESAPWVWLVHCLAEADRFDEAAAVEIPKEHAEELTTLRAGYAGLARLCGAADADVAAAVDAVLDARHAPLYSLALRRLEAARLFSDRRWPDLPSVWYAHDCRMEMKAEGEKEHPSPPPAADAAAAARWLRLHWSCADYPELVAALRAAKKPPAGLDECEMEQHLAFGRVDAAAAVAERLAKEAGDDASGELCVDRARIAQLRGEPAVPSQFAGWDDARLRLKPSVAWLEMAAVTLSNRPLDARTCADRVADPSHREFVEAALVRRRGRPA